MNSKQLRRVATRARYALLAGLVSAGVSVASVPTLYEWGLIVLTGLLAWLVMARVRRSQRLV